MVLRGVRLGLRLLGVAGLAWAAAAFTALPDLGLAREVGDRIASGQSYPAATVARWADTIGRTVPLTCEPSFLVNGLIVQSRAAEQAIDGGTLADIDPRLAAVRQSAMHLIDCAPTQALGWLSLVWSERVQSGSNPGQIRLLAEAYRTAPYEPWIEVRRSPLAMTVYDRLPADLQARALDEFFRIVERYETRLAVAVFQRLDDTTQRIVVDRLKTERSRGASFFARKLSDAGVPVDLPELLNRPDRPWLRM